MSAVFFVWSEQKTEPAYLDWRENAGSRIGGWIALDSLSIETNKAYWRRREIPDTIANLQFRAHGFCFKELTRCQVKKLLRDKGFDYLEVPK